MSVLDGVAERLISSRLVPLIEEYAGPNCKNIRLAILLNIDLMELYARNENVGGYSLSQVRGFASKFPEYAKFVSSAFVVKWLKEARRDDIVEALNETAGGMLWLDAQIEKVRREIYG